MWHRIIEMDSTLEEYQSPYHADALSELSDLELKYVWWANLTPDEAKRVAAGEVREPMDLKPDPRTKK